MRHFTISIASAALALSAFAAVARADPALPPPWLYERVATTPMIREQFYAAFSLNAGIQQLPRFNSTTTLSINTAIPQPFIGPAAFSPEVLGVEPGGEAGYVFRDGTFPAWMGNRIRAAVYGSYFNASGKDQKVQVLPANGLAYYYGVGGTFRTAFGIGGQTYVERLKVERDSWQIGLKLESDVALGPNLSLSPVVAVFGGMASDSYVHDGRIANIIGLGFDTLPTGINERLRTREIGGHLGARIAWQFHPGWALHFGGTAGPVWLRTRLQASDCFNIASVATDVPCGPGAVSFQSSVSDSRSALGFRGTAMLGLSADMRSALISFGGFMRYDSHIPGVVNPQLAGPIVTLPALQPAHVRFSGGFAYGGFLTLRVPLH